MKIPRATARRVGETAARQRTHAPARNSVAARSGSEQALPIAKGLLEHVWIDRDLGAWLLLPASRRAGMDGQPGHALGDRPLSGAFADILFR